MKRILVGALTVTLIMGCSVHFSVVYLNWIRTLGIGFTPGVSAFMVPDVKPAHKGFLQAR
jgi:hypothetical protein